VPCGGGLEYLHRSPTSHKRRQKGNPVPGGITGSSCFWGDINTETWPSRLGESQMRQQNMVVSSAGLGPKSDCSVKAQKQLYK
jgi:hypothetical protein